MRLSRLATSIHKLGRTPLKTFLPFSHIVFPGDHHCHWHSSVATNRVTPTLEVPHQVAQQNSSISLFENVEEHWTTPKKDVVRDLTTNPIPSTRKWTIDEFGFFKLHYYPVTDLHLWHNYLCDDAPLTTTAQEVINMALGFDDILAGNYAFACI
jgi:hypothetical protein